MYEEVAFKFVQHFMWIAYAMDRVGENHDEMWDEEDGFFYDLLRLPDGQSMRLKVRSMVGLLPLCASTVFEGDIETRYPKLTEMIALFRRVIRSSCRRCRRPTRGSSATTTGGCSPSSTRSKLERVLGYMLDENEFLGPHGIRSLSRYHQDHPFTFRVGQQRLEVRYLPAESDSGMFGGNSNWRGPVWMPVNAPDRPRAAQPVRLLRRRLQSAVSDRLGPVHDAVRSGEGDRPAAREHVPARRERTASGVRRNREVPERPALARPDPVLRVLPRRQRRRARREPSDGMDRAHRPAARSLRARRGETVLELEAERLRARMVAEQVGGERVTR